MKDEKEARGHAFAKDVNGHRRATNRLPLNEATGIVRETDALAIRTAVRGFIRNFVGH